MKRINHKLPESVITIANRYCDGIAAEIRLMPDRISKDITTNNFGGFMYLNLATKGEMLNKYFGDKLRAIGLGKQLETIVAMCEDARQMQQMIDISEGFTDPYCFANNEKMKENFIKQMIVFNLKCQKFLPSLFFI